MSNVIEKNCYLFHYENLGLYYYNYCYYLTIANTIKTKKSYAMYRVIQKSQKKNIKCTNSKSIALTLLLKCTEKHGIFKITHNSQNN